MSRAKLELKAKGALWKMPRGTPRGTTIQMKADFPSKWQDFQTAVGKKWLSQILNLELGKMVPWVKHLPNKGGNLVLNL